MDQKITAQEIIDKWPSKAALADDVSRHTGISLGKVAVNRWHSRQSIPAKYDIAIVRAADERNIRVSLACLVATRTIHTEQRGHAPATLQVQSGDAA